MAFICSQVNAHSFSVSSIEAYFNDIKYKMKFVELYGGTQRILGKRQIEGFTIFKNSYGKLIETREKLSDQQIEEKVCEIEPIFRYLDEKETPYVYLTSILPVQDSKELPISIEDSSAKNSKELLSKLTKRKYNVLDIRRLSSIKEIEPAERFYYTDHHWSIQACFNTYLELIDYINSEKILTEKIVSYSKSDFEDKTIPDSFLGSYGIKVGKYYAGKDDFSYKRPVFKTDMVFTSITQDGKVLLSKSGSWDEALMDQSLLEDANYNNKYAAFLNQGSIENRIENKEAGNDEKLLLIAHSYGRPLAQYLSLNFAEVRMLDPQEDRFNGNYLDYIEHYDPDIVVFLTEFEGEIIGNYKTSEEN